MSAPAGQPNFLAKWKRPPLVDAFAFSFLVHILVIMAVEIGREAGLWKATLLPKAVREAALKVPSPEPPPVSVPEMQQQSEPPLMFIEVDPAASQEKAPDQAKYYSTANTSASNPDLADTKTPRVRGKQDKVPRTIDITEPAPQISKPEPKPKSQAEVMQPRFEPQPDQPDAKEEVEPLPAQRKIGDEDMRVAEKLKDREQKPREAARPPEQSRRPRTLAEARAQKGLIPGPRMTQEGGVRRLSIGSNLDVKASPFGSYDAAFIAAVQSRWYQLLDEREFTRDQTGKVILEFRLNSDGRITAMKVEEAEVTEMLAWFCQRAVLDPAPYMPFPNDLRRLLNKDYREVRFTFYY